MLLFSDGKRVYVAADAGTTAWDRIESQGARTAGFCRASPRSGAQCARSVRPRPITNGSASGRDQRCLKVIARFLIRSPDVEPLDRPRHQNAIGLRHLLQERLPVRTDRR